MSVVVDGLARFARDSLDAAIDKPQRELQPSVKVVYVSRRTF